MPTLSLLRRLPGLPALLALLAVAGAVYCYFTGGAATLPLRLVPHLAPVPLVLDSVAAGPAWLPLPVSGYLTTLTHDMGGPYPQPLAAGLWLGTLALALAGWLAVVSMLRRPAFLTGTVPVVFLLLSLNADGLGVFNPTRQYFLALSLSVLGAAALGLRLFGDRVRAVWRVLIFEGLMAGLVALIITRTQLPLAETALHLAAYATPAGAALVALLALWVGVENIRALLWFNSQAERPMSRFGRLPFVLASLLYLGALGLYWWNNDNLLLAGGWHLDPLVLLLPAVLTGGLGLRYRAPSYAGWLPYPAARPLYWLLTAAAAAAVGYALATNNAPLLDAMRSFSGRALLLLGAAFLLYVLINFGTLIKQRLRVYRVVFEPRRLPFYAVYILGVGGLLLMELRNGWPLLDQVRAGQYNQLGDLARLQSEARPDDLPLALLAERYYAESGDVLDRFNQPAQLGRAALYRFRDQRQNELNALRRALLRQPSAKVSLHLNALLTGPADFLDALDGLRQARRTTPRNFALTSDLAQLFTRSSLTDSVAVYLDKAEQLRPGSAVARANQLAFLLSQNLLPAARKLAALPPPATSDPALLANLELTRLLAGRSASGPAPPADLNRNPDLDDATFAQLYHAALLAVRAGVGASRQLLPRLAAAAERPANAPYYEQLVFLQALLKHAAGQELAARQTLAPLTAGASATAGFFQYVLGLWQLQQRQYATAADQLARAGRSGFAEARPAQAWALVLAGQPDSAAALARRLALDSAQRSAARQLLAALAGGRQLADSSGSVIGNEPLAAARAAEANPAQATRLYQQVIAEAPFNEAAVLAAARYFTQQKDYTNAYDALNRGLTENPASEALLKAYALAAAAAGLFEMGQSALAELRPRLSPAEYATLLTQFAARRAAHAAASAAFDQPAVPRF